MNTYDNATGFRPYLINAYLHLETCILHYFSHCFKRDEQCLTICLLVSSADSFCKQFGTRSGPTERRA